MELDKSLPKRRCQATAPALLLFVSFSSIVDGPFAMVLFLMPLDSFGLVDTSFCRSLGGSLTAWCANVVRAFSSFQVELAIFQGDIAPKANSPDIKYFA